MQFVIKACCLSLEDLGCPSPANSWVDEKSGNGEQTGAVPFLLCAFALPIFAQSLRAFLFNGSDASPDLGCGLLPNLLLLFLIRSRPHSAAGPGSASHQPAPALRSPGVRANRGWGRAACVWEGALLGDCREKLVLPGGSVTGRGDLGCRQGNARSWLLGAGGHVWCEHLTWLKMQAEHA